MNAIFDNIYKERITERIFVEGVSLREQGKTIIGVYCAFTPKEILSAAGAIPVALCAGTNDPIATAEKHLPRILCPLIKSTFGHALQGTCRYMEETSFIFADMTCDGKKKMFEFLGKIKPMHLLALPQENSRKQSMQYWIEELKVLKTKIEEVTGNSVTNEALAQEIHRYNGLRAAIETVYGLNKGPVPLLFGREIDVILEEAGGFECFLEERTANILAAADTARQRLNDSKFIAHMRSKPRILLTGCPTTNNKLLDIIEDAGGVVVAMENCGGLKTTRPVRSDGDPLQALAERYLAVPCPCMSPNTGRLELLRELAEDYHIQGVVELTWEACHTYNVEAGLVQDFVSKQLQLPYLQVRTDYTENDLEQIRLRVDAFLELF